MKKPSSGLGVGLWAVGGLVALYLLGGVAYWYDALENGSQNLENLPRILLSTADALYLWSASLINRIIINPHP